MASASSKNNNNKEENESTTLESHTEGSQEMSIHWVEEHPDCSVCLQPCLQPVLLPCQHIFCFLCLKGFAYRSKKCALCRREVTLEYFENPIVVKVRKSNQSTELTNTSIDKYDWFYEGRNGWWQYDERASSVLEAAFKSEVRSCELLVAGFLYVIDFLNMVQYRKTNPERCRRVKRDRANIDRKGIAGLKEISKISLNDKQTKEENTTINKIDNNPVDSNATAVSTNQVHQVTDVLNTLTLDDT